MITKFITLALAIRKHFSDNVVMNWKQLIQEIIASGMTQSEIATKCGTGQSHISSLLTGYRKSPGWKLGDSLIRLHRRSKKRASQC